MKQEVDSALRLVPNDGYLVMLAALFQTDMDWLAEAEATFQRAIEINPREPKVFYNYAFLQTKKGDVSKARWASDRSLELAPESVFFRLFRAIQEFRWTGEVARTKKFLAEIPAGKDPDGRVTAAHCTAAVYERNFPEALRLLAACPSERLPYLYGGFGDMVPKGFVEGLIHFYAGNKERAYTALDSARWILEVEAKENPGDQAGPLSTWLSPTRRWAGRMPRWRKSRARKISRTNLRWRRFSPMPASATPHCAPSSRFLLQSESTGITSCVCTRNGIHFVATRALKKCSRLLHRKPRGDPRFEKIVASLAPK